MVNLIGAKVMHTTFGTGVVTEQADNYVTVKFATKTAKFIYPDSFEKFLKVEAVDVQAAIMKSISEAKAAAEHKRQAEAAAEEQRRVAISVVEPNLKKVKSLDEMFAPDYHAEKLARQPILTYQQVEDRFGIRISGFGRGINPTDDTVVLISSIGKVRGSFVYHDKWTEDGDYLYSGEGRAGDQAMTKGNLAIRDAARDGKKIHLFVKFSPREYYYQGVFELVDYTYEDDKDENGNIRKEYKFRLRKLA
ncbi:MAG: hypothetical protein LUE21_10420 [Oscillospiraceae bacterium]|nr:hypothetical protein [Oscillospiraceae bacterium]